MRKSLRLFLTVVTMIICILGSFTIILAVLLDLGFFSIRLTG